MFDEPIILCGSGASIPILNNFGIQEYLSSVIRNHYSVGLNSFFRFGCETTWVTWNDGQFYRDNKPDLEKLPLIIGKYDPNVRHQILDNAFLIPSSKTYFGKNGLQKNRKMCWNCKQEFLVGNDFVNNCPFCKSREILQCGLYHAQLVGLFTLSLVIALGFTEIYLLGFDGRSINGKTHFYQDLINLKELKQDKVTHKDGTTRIVAERLRWFGVGKKELNGKTVYNTGTYNNTKELNEKWFSVYKKTSDVKIYNISPQSAIQVFPKLTYGEFFERIKDTREINQDNARKRIRRVMEEKIG